MGEGRIAGRDRARGGGGDRQRITDTSGCFGALICSCLHTGIFPLRFTPNTFCNDQIFTFPSGAF